MDGMDAEEFGEWLAFDAIEPLGGIGDDYRAGVIAAMIANVNRRKGTDPIRPFDFFPWQNPPRDPKQDSLAIKQAMRRLADKAKRNG